MTVFKFEMLNTVERNMKETKAAFDKLTEKSWQKRVSTLPANAKVPEKGRFYFDEDRQAFNAEVSRLQDEAMKAVQGYIDGLTKQAATAPSEEALRSVSMFAMMNPDAMSVNEYADRLNSLVETYGDNVITHETLRSLGRKHGVTIAKHPAVEQSDTVAVVKNNVNSFFTNNIRSGNMNEQPLTDAEVAFKLAFIRNEAAKLPGVE